MALIRSPWIGIATGAALWFALFSPAFPTTRLIHGHFFWTGMVFSTVLLAAMAYLAQEGQWGRILHFERRWVALGLVHAVFLYGLSRLGVFLMVELFGTPVVHYIEQIYSTRSQLPPAVVAGLLLIIAPAEELVWRGWVQDKLGLPLATAIYCLIHLPAFNPPLLVAALVLGLHWGFLYKRTGSLVAGLVSHLAWDVTIFCLLPIRL